MNYSTKQPQDTCQVPFRLRKPASFNGHFRTSPVGLVEKVPGDGNWQMIRHLSKTDHLGFSTNDALDSHDFPTLFFSAAHVAELVCVSPITVLLCPFSCLAATCKNRWPLVRSFGRLLHHLTTCRWPLAVLLASCSFIARLLACAHYGCQRPTRVRDSTVPLESGGCGSVFWMWFGQSPRSQAHSSAVCAHVCSVREGVPAREFVCEGLGTVACPCPPLFTALPRASILMQTSIHWLATSNCSPSNPTLVSLSESLPFCSSLTIRWLRSMQ